ncbi:hypothetical protein DV515_00015683 [Chloebia gouldiae]|uniref:Uncharacterized protein n=1 Tax=Chloebia gouldiae TaxID=44316 RepID=A0A3L8RUT9_CHLGU|nr:hypothetical protein DV515_00015683 [Chloebia gouldiae]
MGKPKIKEGIVPKMSWHHRPLNEEGVSKTSRLAPKHLPAPAALLELKSAVATCVWRELMGALKIAAWEERCLKLFSWLFKAFQSQQHPLVRSSLDEHTALVHLCQGRDLALEHHQ